MYEMAKKAREALRGKAKRLAGEKDSKVDSSNWTPAAPLDADIKTGMRPVSKQGLKKGGKVEGAKEVAHAGRKPRKSGGRAITADSLINRDQKEANEAREGKKHDGGLKRGGRAGKALGGMPTDALKSVRNQTMGFKKGGRAHREEGGFDYSYTGRDTVTEDKPPVKKAIPQPPRRPPDLDGDYDNSRTGAGTVTRARKAGGKVNFGPAENVGGKKGVSTSEQIAEEKCEQNASKPKRGKAGHYADGGAPGAGPAPANDKQGFLKFGVGAPGSPYKKGGMAKHEDVAEDKALIKKMVKPEARTGKLGGGPMSDPAFMSGANAMYGRTAKKRGGEDKRPGKFGGGALGDVNMGPAKAAGGKAGKGKTNINIVISPNAGQPSAGGPPGMPPGMPPRPPGGVPVPMGMPPAGGAPGGASPMPMPPAPPMPPMARKAGGKVYKTYKDMDAGAGSGLGRLEKTEIQKRKG